MENFCSIDSVIEDLIKNLNKWHRDPKEIMENKKVRDVLKLNIKPRIFSVLERIFSRGFKNKPSTWGVIILRGPRQIGKTTLVYYLVYRAISEYNIDSRSIIYIDLSYSKLRQCLDERLIDLGELIRRLIKGLRKPILLIIDEASLYSDWSLVIKNLVDYGIITDGVATIVTGSHAVDLATEHSHLIGRYGPLCEDSEIRSGPHQYYYPLRFSEFSESLNDDIYRVFYELKLRLVKTKYAILRSILDPNIDPNKIWVLRNLLNYNDLLESLFEQYIMIGGYPSMVAYIKENIESIEKGVPSYMYEIIYSGLLSDLNRFTKYDLREEIFIELIKSISEHHIEKKYGLEVSYDDLIELLRQVGLASSLPYKSKEYIKVFRAHLDYLKGIKAVIEVKPLKFTKNLPIKSGKPLAKLVFTDPSMAIAVYAFTHDIPDPYRFIKNVLKEHGLPNLVEAITLSHLARVPMLLGSEGTIEEPIGYLVRHREEPLSGEKTKYIRQGEIDGITWFFSYKNGIHVFVPVEVKYSRDKNYIDEKYVNVVKQAPVLHKTRLIITVAFGAREIYCDEFKGLKYIVLPLPLFLALF